MAGMVQLLAFMINPKRQNVFNFAIRKGGVKQEKKFK